MNATTKSFLTLLIAASLNAGDLPELILPQGVGVNIHFARGHGPCIACPY